jgi:hypothetical protein
LAARQPAAACCGDCNGDGNVTIDELMRGVRITLGLDDMQQCPSFNVREDDRITVDELLRGVAASLDGCPSPIITTIAGPASPG